MFNNDFLVLEFGYYNIKLMVVSKDNKGIRVKRMDLIPTIEGSIANGRIMSIDKVVGQLSNHLISNHIKAKKVIITVTTPSMMLREAEVLNHRRAIINSFIKIEAKSFFPIDLSECIVDYKIIPDQIDEEEEQAHKIMMVAIPSEIINEYISVAKRLGLHIHTIDVASDCIAELYTKRKTDEAAEQIDGEDSEVIESNSTVFIDIGAEMTNITIATDGIMKYNKVLNFGVSYINHAIALNTPLEAESVEDQRRNLDLFHGYSQEEAQGPDKLIQVITKDFLENLSTFFQFHVSRKTGNKVDNIIIIGGGAYQRGIGEIIGEFYGTSVSSGFEFEGIYFDQKVNRIDQKMLCFYNCLGASLKI